MLRILFSLLLVSIVYQGHAQFSYGVKVGLNFNRFSGPSETDDAGEDLEAFNGSTGFHVGATFRYAFLEERFGFQSNLMYSQKGGEIVYNGQGIQTFTSENGVKVFSEGNTLLTLDISNSYIDIPFLVWGKPLRSLEVFGGFNIGFLVISNGEGNLQYSGAVVGNPQFNGLMIDEFDSTLDYNYYGDDIGEADFTQSSMFVVGNEVVNIPGSQGAYFNFDTDEGNFFNVIDFGLKIGVNFNFNESLYLGYTFNYGLTDVTNNAYDFARARYDGTEMISREDTDRNVSSQLSLGFSF